MKNNLTIAVDCDITLVHSDLHWLEWLQNVTGTHLYLSGRLDYDLTKYFKDELTYQGLTGYEFWNSTSLYDNMEPVEGSVEALQHLKDLGYTLVCLSRTMGHHSHSKRNFIEKYFPMFDATYLCGKDQKHFFKCDYIIEDRIPELKHFTKDTKGIILNNRYLEPCSVGCSYFIAEDWSEVVDLLK